MPPSKPSHQYLKVCRTCLKKTYSSKIYSVHRPLNEQKDDVKIQQALSSLVPELYMGVSSDPVICQDCKISLRIAYYFKKACVETEQVVGNYLKTICVTGKQIDLMDVVDYQKGKKVIPRNPEVVTIDDEETSKSGGKNLTFCEQSGLFVDENGHFFNASGQPINQSQIEAEKANITDKIDKLFEITSVFSLSEEAGEPTKEPTEDAMPEPSNCKESTSTDEPKDPPKKNWIKIVPKEKLFGPKTSPPRPVKPPAENPKKRNYVEVDVTVTTDNGEVNKKMKILNEEILNNNIRNTPKKTVVPEKAVSQDPAPPNVKETESAKESPIQYENSPSRCLIDIPDRDTAPLITKPQKYHWQRMMIRQPKKIKGNKEPTETEQQPVTTPDPPDDNISEIIKNLYDDGSQYVDVPEFIQIKQFTFSDLKDMQLKKKVTTNKTASPQITESDSKEEEPKKSDEVATENPVPPTETAENTETPLSDATEQVCDVLKPVKKVTEKEKLYKKRRRNNGNCGITILGRLLESYSCDGTYIKDHDYLGNPYKAEDILRTEGDQLMSFCYICGSLHPLESHVEHMSVHPAYCDLCKINYGTPFAFNIHAKIHDVRCEKCSTVVPYHKNQAHTREHERDLAETFKRVLEPVKDEMPLEDEGNKKTERRSRRRYRDMQAILHQSKEDCSTSLLRSRLRRSEHADVDYKESDSESTDTASE